MFKFVSQLLKYPKKFNDFSLVEWYWWLNILNTKKNSKKQGEKRRRKFSNFYLHYLYIIYIIIEKYQAMLILGKIAGK